jgi:hypothetical protein
MARFTLPAHLNWDGPRAFRAGGHPADSRALVTRAALRSQLKPHIEAEVHAILRNLEVLGEAAKHVPEAPRQLDGDIAWRRIAGLREMLAHAYFGIDDDIV